MVRAGVSEFGYQPEEVAENNPVQFVNQFPEDDVGVPIQTFTSEQISRSTFSRKLNYVVDADGSLVLGRVNDALGGGHIDIARGNPALAAGEVRIVNGKIISVDNSSGHYLPTGPSAQRAAERAFRNAGFDISGKYIEKVWNGTAWVPVAK
jgi:filamentous hemagglutinin